MNLLTRKRDFLRSLLPHVRAKLTKLFSFGCATLVAQNVTSTRANARRSTHVWATAKSKMWRLSGNVQLTAVFAALTVRGTHVDAADTVAVDFSDFGDGRQVLLFAKQTRHGRPIPLYFEIVEYPIKKSSQNLFVIAAIKRFYAAVFASRAANI